MDARAAEGSMKPDAQLPGDAQCRNGLARLDLKLMHAGIALHAQHLQHVDHVAIEQLPPPNIDQQVGLSRSVASI